MFDQWLKIEFDSSAQPEATIVCAISRRTRPYIIYIYISKIKIGRKPWARSLPVGIQRFLIPFDQLGPADVHNGSYFFRSREITVPVGKRIFQRPTGVSDFYFFLQLKISPLGKKQSKSRKKQLKKQRLLRAKIRYINFFIWWKFSTSTFLLSQLETADSPWGVNLFSFFESTRTEGLGATGYGKF